MLCSDHYMMREFEIEYGGDHFYVTFDIEDAKEFQWALINVMLHSEGVRGEWISITDELSQGLLKSIETRIKEQCDEYDEDQTAERVDRKLSQDKAGC
jgi:hypothetical protein